MAERRRRWKDAHAEQWRDQKRAQDERRRRKNGSRSQAEISAEAEQRRLAQKAAADARKSERLAKPWNAPGLTSAEKWRIRYRDDKIFAVSERVRTAFRRKRYRYDVAKLARDAIRRGGESPTLLKLVGWSIEDLTIHLERQFGRGMNWGEFCAGRIHIDHVRPLASFDLGNIEEFRDAWSLPNLRPMWWRENIEKGYRSTLLL